MSRSYRKTPRCGDNKGKAKKRVANKSVRRWQKDNPDTLLRGSSFKKIFESWNICDYEEVFYSFEQYYDFHIKIAKLFNRPILSKEEAYKEWYKIYKRK